MSIIDYPELTTLLMQGEEKIGHLAQGHPSWGPDNAEHWDLDQQTGTLTWTFPHMTVSAKAQVLATYSPTGGSWMWAWANAGIQPELASDSGKIRTWGQTHGHPQMLTEAVVAADDQMADTLSELALRITEATGYFRAPTGTCYKVMTYGPATVTTDDGASFTLAGDEIE